MCSSNIIYDVFLFDHEVDSVAFFFPNLVGARQSQ